MTERAPGEGRSAGAETQPAVPTQSEVESQPGFPREDMVRLVRHLPAYGRLAWALAKDPRLSKARRALVVAGAAYVFSPIDAIPGIVPVLGQLDDIAVALGVIRVALDGLKPDVRAERLAAAGLSEQDLADDVAATKSAVAWLGRSGLRVGRRAISTAADTGLRVGGRLRELGGQLGDRASEQLPEASRRARDAGASLRRRIGR